MVSSESSASPGPLWGEAIVRRVDHAAQIFRQHAPSPANLLDIGCGVGTISEYLGHELGLAQVHGIDVSENLVSEAVKRGVRARQVDLDASPLPFPDASFDAVFCGEVIEHVLDTDRLLDEIERVLTPSGLCVMSTPNLASWVNRVALLLGWQPFFTTVSSRYLLGRPSWSSAGYEDGGIGHLHVFTTRSLLELIAVHRLPLVTVKPYSLRDTMNAYERKLGGSKRHTLLNWGGYLDDILSRNKALAIGVVIAFRRRDAVPASYAGEEEARVPKSAI